MQVCFKPGECKGREGETAKRRMGEWANGRMGREGDKLGAPRSSMADGFASVLGRSVCVALGGRPLFLLLIYQGPHTERLKTGAMYVQEKSDIVAAPSASPSQSWPLASPDSRFDPS